MAVSVNTGVRLFNRLDSSGHMNTIFDTFKVRKQGRISIPKFDPYVAKPWDEFLTMCHDMDLTDFWSELTSSNTLSVENTERLNKLHRRIMRDDFMPRIWRATNYALRRDCILSLGMLFLDTRDMQEDLNGILSVLPNEIKDIWRDFTIQVRPMHVMVAEERKRVKRKPKPGARQLELPLKAWRNCVVVGPAYFKTCEIHGIYTEAQLRKISERVMTNRKDRTSLMNGIENEIIEDSIYIDPRVVAMIEETKTVRPRDLKGKTRVRAELPQYT